MEFLWETVKNVWARYNCSRSFEETLAVLKSEMKELNGRKSDLENELKKVEVMHERRQEVSLWLKNVEKIAKEVSKIEEDSRDVRRYFSLWRLALVELVVKKIEEVVNLKENVRVLEGLLADPLPESGSMPLTKLVGRTTAKRNVEQIWESLMDQEVRTIGVYGMGGIGKTTIMTHIYNRIKSSTKFGIAIWVTVSNDDYNIEKLQNCIARAIGLELSNEEDEMRRSMKLFRALNREEMFVIILDDMWKPFPFEKVGIPKGNAYKIIFTTRSKTVCQGMECQFFVKVDPLSREEAWELFKETFGADVVLSSDIELIAKLVADECGGLPLGIITVACAMREKDEVREWRNALEELKCSTIEIEGMDDQVFQNLKFSYDRIKSERIRSCFLYCALFPKDYEFHDEELIKYWRAEELIGDMGDWEKEHNKGHTILNELIDVCMLMRRFDYRVVMHALIRHLAIGITRKSPRFLVKAGMGIKGSIDAEELTEDVYKISLMRNEIEMLSGHPNCPKLSTLLLRENPLSGNISHGFFNHMNNLRVLDLSFTEIVYVPKSVSNLENLSALLLKQCRRLRKVPSLAKLRHLRFLDLFNTGIKEVPHGIECLVNLEELHVSSAAAGTNRKNAVDCNSVVLPDGIVWLVMSRCDLSSFPCLSRLQRLQECIISYSSMKWLLTKGDNSTKMFLPSIQSLFLNELPDFRGLCEEVLPPGSFACLKFLSLYGCPVLENLMSLELFQHLQCLEEIIIEECNEMEQMIQGGEAMVEEGDNNNNNNTILLPNLRRFHLMQLGKLKSICNSVITCPSLNEIYVVHCYWLKKIPLSLGNSTSVVSGMMEGSQEWWDALEWDDPSTKTLLLRLFQGEVHGLKRKAEQELQQVASTSWQWGSPR